MDDKDYRELGFKHWPECATRHRVNPNDRLFKNPGGEYMIDAIKLALNFWERNFYPHTYSLIEKVRIRTAQRFTFEKGLYDENGFPKYIYYGKELVRISKESSVTIEEAVKMVAGNIESCADKCVKSFTGDERAITPLSQKGRELWIQVCPDVKVDKNSFYFVNLEVTGHKSYPLVTSWYERNVKAMVIGKERLALVAQERFVQRSLMQQDLYTIGGYPDYEKLGTLAEDGKALGVLMDNLRHSSKECAEAYRKDIVRSPFNPLKSVVIPATIAASGFLPNNKGREQNVDQSEPNHSAEVVKVNFADFVERNTQTANYAEFIRQQPSGKGRAV